ncbi:hypothetical protein [Methanosarcina sp.]|uniref:hypothetical protein n=1 Tax=Methanosarcina sp. TaxID=2213 RepID=UPI0029888790|nr:hypothetical protein [Methanosarcina sp.]MDW5549353.1 hypothetical protein [Methanosarcina sp.]MDW5553456.1 hypothetical protein [Methanosarcina sp.]MDW5559780.1 hypothetical protein [Methanosarcina sp.]
MKRGIVWFSGIFLLVVTYFLSAPALAHVPIFGGEGKSIETAIQIEDPSKSRVFYGELDSGDFRYYGFNVEKGERIVLGLTIPVEDGNKGFTPHLILIGPGFKDEGKIPDKLEMPEGYGAKVLSYNLPENPVYEGFTPSAFYSPVKLDIKAPESGMYYAVVGAPQETDLREENVIYEKGLQEREIPREGNYGLILGYREIFTLKEWLSIPLSQIKIYHWEGQSLFLILTPLALTFAAGLLAIFLKRETVAEYSPARISGMLAGLFFLGTGVTYIFQMLISLSKSSYSSEIGITLFLILLNIGLGIIAIALILRNENYGKRSARKRLYFFGLGILGLLFWAGWFIGPFLAFEAALLPWKLKR